MMYFPFGDYVSLIIDQLNPSVKQYIGGKFFRFY